jgi:hypothetical protein
MSMMAVRQRTKQATDQAMVTETQVRTTPHRCCDSCGCQRSARRVSLRSAQRGAHASSPARLAAAASPH